MGRLGGEPLGLGDDPLLDLVRLGPGLLAGGLVLFPPVLDGVDQGRQPGLEAVQVADRVRVADRGGQPGDGGPGLACRQVGAGHALLEQADLGLQRVELALEEGQRLIGAAGLPRADLSLTVGGADIHRPVVGYPAPRIACGAHRIPPARYLISSHATQVLLIVTLSISTLSFGAPPP